MAREWRELTQLTRGAPLTVERVRLVESGIAVEGAFELPLLARLSAEDQVFIMAFVKSHGSIKEMERFFGVSYPTIKSRLQRLGEQLALVESLPIVHEPEEKKEDIIAMLESGELTAREAIERLSL